MLLEEVSSSESIAQLILKITPYDQIEQDDIIEALKWIRSGAPVFRQKKPDEPPKHLCSYVVVYDETAQKVLLMNHKLSQLWLPAGGHVEQGEYPTETAYRECIEELGIRPIFWKDEPVFLTSTITVGLTPGHNDVNLWYVVKGSSKDSFCFDSNEFKEFDWFSFPEIPYERADQHMQRFVAKLKSLG